MPVSSIYTSDLLTVKEFYENGALKQDGMGPTLVPADNVLRNQSALLSAASSSLATYPASYAPAASESKLAKLQRECIPCLERLRSLKGLDVSSGLSDVFRAMNDSVRGAALSLLNQLTSPGDVDRHLCELYNALNANCVPDIARAIAALEFLIADIRTFDLKISLKGFLQSIAVIAAKLAINGTVGFDKFVLAIKGAVDCIIGDVENQLRKLQPILSADGRAKAAKGFEDAWKDTETFKANQAKGVYSTKDDCAAVKALDSARASTNAVLSTVAGMSKISLSAKTAVATPTTTPPTAMSSTAYPYGSLKPESQASLNGITAELGTDGKSTVSSEWAAAAKADAAAKKAAGALAEVSALIDHTLGEASSRAIGYLENKKAELFKLLKLNGADAQSLNDFIRQVQNALSLIALLRSLLGMKSGGAASCSPQQAANRFFAGLTLPNATVNVESPGAGISPGADSIVTVAPNPVVVGDPVVRRALEDAGVTLRTTTSGQTVVAADPVVFSLFGCLGAPKQD